MKWTGQPGSRTWPWASFWEQLQTFQSSFLASTTWPTDFQKAPFLVPPNGVGMTRHHGAWRWGQSCSGLCTAETWTQVCSLGIFQSWDQFAKPVFYLFCLVWFGLVLIAHHYSFRPFRCCWTEPVSKAIRIHKRPSAEKIFWMITL